MRLSIVRDRSRAVSLDCGGYRTETIVRPSSRSCRAGLRADRPERMACGRGVVLASRGGQRRGSDASSAVRLPARRRPRLGPFELTKGRVRFVAEPDATLPHRDSRCRSSSLTPQRGKIGDRVRRSRHVHHQARRSVRRPPPGSAAVRRTNFKGLRYFPLQTAYRVEAKFVPYTTPKWCPSRTCWA